MTANNTLPKLSQKLACLCALLAGALGTLAFSPFDITLAALLSLSGLLYFILNRTAKQASGVAFCWGLGLFGSGVNWVYISMQEFGGLSPLFCVALVVLLASYLSLYPMLFAWFLTSFKPRKNWITLILAAPALWQVTEFLRGYILTGFPWLQFGYSQIDGSLKGIAPILGVDGITFLLMTFAGLLVYGIKQRKLIPLLLVVVGLLLPYLLQKIEWVSPQPNRSLNVALVQGNIAQSLKWRPDQLESTLKTYLDNSRPYFDHVQMVIWPEAAIPDIEIRQNIWLTQLDSLLRQHNTALLTGIIDLQKRDEQLRYFNSVIALGNSTPYHYLNRAYYQKHHLVIFGEFVPFERVLRPLAAFFNLPMSSMSRGKYIQPPLKVNGYQITNAICYEIILGEQLRANFTPETDFLLTISNDAWFGNSIGPWQHFQMARMRALELGRPLLRSTNNGITAVIDAQGNIQAQLPQFQELVLEATVTPTRGVTPYAKYGSQPLWVITMLCLIITGFSYRRPSWVI